jgi:exopolysaccharide biosynthesis operon protein EpsL
MRPAHEASGALRFAWRLTMVMLGCAAAPAAQGREGNVFTPYAALSLTMDNNLFRLPEDVNVAQVSGRSERGDLIRTLQAGLRGERYIGRQRLSFDVSANQNRYRTYAYLNADLVNAAGTWIWQLGHDLSGEIGTDQVQALTGFNDIRSAARNVTTTRVDRATANYNLHPSWRLSTALYETNQKNSAAERASANFKTEALEAGVTYMPASGNRVTLRARSTRATYPTRQVFLGTPINNDFVQDDLETEASWQISGQSRLSMLLAQTRRHYADLPQRDYNGPVGRLNWEWQASGKTLLNAGLKREIGAYQDFTTNYIVTDSVSLTVTYLASIKTQVQGRLENKSRRFLGDPGFVLTGVERRVDHVNSASLSVSHDLAWAMRISASLQKESRRSNTAGFNYDDTSATLSLQITW